MRDTDALGRPLSASAANPRLCRATSKRTGGPCPNAPLHGSDYCYQHEDDSAVPNRAERRRLGGEKTAAKNKLRAKADLAALFGDIDLSTPGGRTALSVNAARAMLAGLISPDMARGLAALRRAAELADREASADRRAKLRGRRRRLVLEVRHADWIRPSQNPHNGRTPSSQVGGTA